MKFLRLLAVFALTGFILTSCQKELEYGSPAGASGTMKSTSGDCLPVTIYGTYQKDTLLNFSNTADVQIDVTEIGSYTIKTDTINGFSFSATGYAGVVGTNTVHLQASGRPIRPEVDVFTVKFDTSICQINVIVTGASGGTGSIPALGFMTYQIGPSTTFITIPAIATYDATGGVPSIDIDGIDVAANEEVELYIENPSGTTVQAGDYLVSQSTNYTEGDLYSPTTLFNAESGAPNGTPTFHIVLSNAVVGPSGTITGSYTGVLTDVIGGSGTVTVSGSFNLPVN